MASLTPAARCSRRAVRCDATRPLARGVSVDTSRRHLPWSSPRLPQLGRARGVLSSPSSKPRRVSRILRKSGGGGGGGGQLRVARSAVCHDEFSDLPQRQLLALVSSNPNASRTYHTISPHDATERTPVVVYAPHRARWSSRLCVNTPPHVSCSDSSTLGCAGQPVSAHSRHMRRSRFRHF